LVITSIIHFEAVMFNRIQTKISGTRQRKLKHDKPKTGTSLSGEGSGSENSKGAALDAGASETEINSSHLSGRAKIVQPNVDEPFQEEIENLIRVTHESHLGDEQHVDATGTRSAEDRLESPLRNSIELSRSTSKGIQMLE
jgi:hypothetical protein